MSPSCRHQLSIPSQQLITQIQPPIPIYPSLGTQSQSILPAAPAHSSPQLARCQLIPGRSRSKPTANQVWHHSHRPSMASPVKVCLLPWVPPQRPTDRASPTSCPAMERDRELRPTRSVRRSLPPLTILASYHPSPIQLLPALVKQLDPSRALDHHNRSYRQRSILGRSRYQPNQFYCHQIYLASALIRLVPRQCQQIQYGLALL